MDQWVYALILHITDNIEKLFWKVLQQLKFYVQYPSETENWCVRNVLGKNPKHIGRKTKLQKPYFQLRRKLCLFINGIILYGPFSIAWVFRAPQNVSPQRKNQLDIIFSWLMPIFRRTECQAGQFHQDFYVFSWKFGCLGTYLKNGSEWPWTPQRTLFNTYAM